MRFLIKWGLGFALGYYGMQYYLEYSRQPKVAEKALRKLEHAADRFCACSPHNKDCLLQELANIKKLIPEMKQHDKNGVRLSKAQWRRGKALQDKVRNCHRLKRQR